MGFFTFQDSQLDHFAPFSWTDFVDYSRSLKAGRRRSTRRVSFVLRHLRPYQILPKGNVLDIGSGAFSYEEMALDMGKLYGLANYVYSSFSVHRGRGREGTRFFSHTTCMSKL
jgi:hypothetical protein